MIGENAFCDVVGENADGGALYLYGSYSFSSSSRGGSLGIGTGGGAALGISEDFLACFAV